MNESKSVTKDPTRSMIVDTTAAFHAERDGKTLYFYCDHCREKLLSTLADAKSNEQSGDCCGG